MCHIQSALMVTCPLFRYISLLVLSYLFMSFHVFSCLLFAVNSMKQNNLLHLIRLPSNRPNKELRELRELREVGVVRLLKRALSFITLSYLNFKLTLSNVRLILYLSSCPIIPANEVSTGFPTS